MGLLMAILEELAKPVPLELWESAVDHSYCPPNQNGKMLDL